MLFNDKSKITEEKTLITRVEMDLPKLKAIYFRPDFFARSTPYIRID